MVSDETSHYQGKCNLWCYLDKVVVIVFTCSCHKSNTAIIAIIAIIAIRCGEVCGGATATRRRGSAGCSSCCPERCAPWSACACTFLPRRKATTSTRTRCGTSWWPPAWFSCCHPGRRSGRCWAGAVAGAGPGGHGCAATRCARAAPTNSTPSREENRDTVLNFYSLRWEDWEPKKKNPLHKSKTKTNLSVIMVLFAGSWWNTFKFKWRKLLLFSPFSLFFLYFSIVLFHHKSNLLKALSWLSSHCTARVRAHKKSSGSSPTDLWPHDQKSVHIVCVGVCPYLPRWEHKCWEYKWQFALCE